MYDGRWIRENADLCTAGKGRDDDPGAKLLAIVISAPANVEARDAIRRSWATPAVKRRDMALAFLVGSSSDSELQVIF